MSKKYKVPQVFYGDWSDDLLSEHENYWWDISTIANWIGYALVGGTHGCRVDLCRSNTIHVSQTKEKFGGVRVYCHFASEEQVQERYVKEISHIIEQNRRYFAWKQGTVTPDSCEYPAKYMIKLYEDQESYPVKTPDIDEFREACRFRDAQHYRWTYRDAVRLWPQYESAIVNSSNFYELLFETEIELDKYYDMRRKDLEKSDYLTDEQKKERADELERDRQHVKNVSGFETKSE